MVVVMVVPILHGYVPFTKYCVFKYCGKIVDEVSLGFFIVFGHTK